jgi:hypothetical protein
MSKLIAIAALLCLVTVSGPVFAQTTCQQRCLTSCPGKGAMCESNCERRCNVLGTARRGSG